MAAAASAASSSSSIRHLSTTISSAAAKSQLRKVFDPDKALTILSSSSSSPSSSSRFAVDLAVRRLARSRRFSDIDSLLQSKLKAAAGESTADEPFLSTLILSYGSASMLSHARSLFDSIPNPTSVSFNALLSSHLKNNKKPKNLSSLVPTLFADLPSTHPSIRPDHVSYSILIKSLCLCENLDKALQALSEMKGKDLTPGVIVYSTLVDAFYKKGLPLDADRLWDEMIACGLEPDTAAYNVRVMYPATSGKHAPEDVLEVIKEMEEKGLKPDAITYNYLITSYCNHGRFEEAKGVYKEFMTKKKKKQRRHQPNAAMFKMLVKALCGNGDFDGGLEVCRDSMKHNKIPDFKTMKALVEGLANAGKTDEAKELVRVVKERFPKELLGGWRKIEKDLGSLSAEKAEAEAEAA